jgi:hypothetical protein
MHEHSVSAMNRSVLFSNRATIDGNMPRSGVSAYLSQHLAMMRGEFFIQQILDVGHLIVDCSHYVFGFPRILGGQFVTFKREGLEDCYTTIFSTIVKLFL